MPTLHGELPSLALTAGSMLLNLPHPYLSSFCHMCHYFGAANLQAWLLSGNIIDQHQFVKAISSLQIVVDCEAVRAVRTQAAALLLQSVWRGTALRLLHRQNKAALVMQSLWRGRQVRMSTVRLRQSQAALVLQAVWRGRAVRLQVSRQHQAALRVQAHWKVFAGRRRYLRQQDAVIKVFPLLLAIMQSHKLFVCFCNAVPAPECACLQDPFLYCQTHSCVAPLAGVKH